MDRWPDAAAETDAPKGPGPAPEAFLELERVHGFTGVPFRLQDGNEQNVALLPQSLTEYKIYFGRCNVRLFE